MTFSGQNSLDMGPEKATGFSLGNSVLLHGPVEGQLAKRVENSRNKVV